MLDIVLMHALLVRPPFPRILERDTDQISLSERQRLHRLLLPPPRCPPSVRPLPLSSSLRLTDISNPVPIIRKRSNDSQSPR